MAFTDSLRFSKGLAFINEVDASKLPKLTSRVAQNIGIDDKQPFTDDEKEKLCEVLGLEMENLRGLLEAIDYTIRQAAYYSWKPQVLSQHLTTAGMQEDRSEILSQAWQKYGREIITRLKKRTLTANQLEKVDWHLNLQVAQSSRSKITEPNVILQLEVSDAMKSGNNNFLMEFNHEELLAFYNKLETIQEQMDALS